MAAGIWYGASWKTYNRGASYIILIAPNTVSPREVNQSQLVAEPWSPWQSIEGRRYFQSTQIILFLESNWIFRTGSHGCLNPRTLALSTHQCLITSLLVISTCHHWNFILLTSRRLGGQQTYYLICIKLWHMIFLTTN